MNKLEIMEVSNVSGASFLKEDQKEVALVVKCPGHLNDKPDLLRLFSVSKLMYQSVVVPLSGTEGMWADKWLNDLAAKCTEIFILVEDDKSNPSSNT